MKANEAAAQVWLDFARADLAMAKAPLPEGGRYEHLCFWAQQAAEKGIKAVLIRRGIDFPFVHNLEILAEMLPPEVRSAPELTRAGQLTAYAVTTRYPFAFQDDPIEKSDYDEALGIAKAVVRWAAELIEEHTPE